MENFELPKGGEDTYHYLIKFHKEHGLEATNMALMEIENHEFPPASELVERAIEILGDEDGLSKDYLPDPDLDIKKFISIMIEESWTMGEIGTRFNPFYLHEVGECQFLDGCELMPQTYGGILAAYLTILYEVPYETFLLIV